MRHVERLYLGWYGDDQNTWYAVGRFDCQDDGYSFRYLAGAKFAQEAEGFKGVAQFPDLSEDYWSAQIFPFIGNRLLSENRPEYQDHTQRLGLEPEDLKPFDVLSRSNGRRATDRYELFAPPHQEGDGSISLHFFVRAVRYLDQPLQELWKEETPGAPLELRREPGNAYDPHAIEIYDSENRKLGYVPRYYTESLSQVVEQQCDYKLDLERHNQEPGFARQRFLVHLQADTPTGWHFPQSDQYDDIETVLDSETEAA